MLEIPISHKWNQDQQALIIIGMNLRILILLLVTFVAFTDKPKIRILSQKNLEQFSKDNSYWLIQIYTGKCPQCAKHQSLLEQVAHSLDGAVKLGKIDSKLIPNIKIEKNPTYMFTRSDEPQKSSPYKGNLNPQEITKFCFQQLHGFVMSRLGGKSSSSSKSESSGSSNKNAGKSQSRSKGTDSSSSQSSKTSSTVIQLNDKVFEQKVLKSNDAWLVEFYSPGCGHCRNFEPQYSKLPKLIGKRVHISRIDGSTNQQFMGKYQVKGFPTVLLFDTENKGEPITYNGERTAEAVFQWLKGQNINEQKKEIYELTQTNYIQECNKNIICFIFILNKKSQKSKLKFLESIVQEQSTKPFRFFISERLPQFESELMIDDRQCPKMVSVWDSQNSYRIYNGQIQHDSITEFLKTALERKRWIKYTNKFSKVFFANNDL